jgi:light-regulated signal transduction histidine kinase (bacteriophytochrome)
MLTTARSTGYRDDVLASLLTELRWNQNYCCIGATIGDWAIVIHSDDSVENNVESAALVAEMAAQVRETTGQTMLVSRDIATDFSTRFETSSICADGAAGLIAYRPAEYPRLTVFAALTEEQSTITWAGNPDIVRKQVVDGEVVISPRSSFAQWQMDERGKSRFWGESDKKLMLRLAEAIRLWQASKERLIHS